MMTCVMLLGTVLTTTSSAPPSLLIQHMRYPSAEVVCIRFEDGELRSSVLLEDLARHEEGSSFQCAQSGRFIYLNTSGTWSVGDVKSGEAPVPIQESLVPENPWYAAVSNGGDQIVWVEITSGRSGRMASLTVTDLQNASNHTISRAGYIFFPAWSPDDAHIAYYHGPPSAIGVDGFVLRRLDLATDDMQDIVVAPPSLPSRPAPLRDRPPLWSPDGRRLLFEARYDSSIPPEAPRYHVAASGAEPPERAEGFRWYRDGDHLLKGIEPNEDDSEWQEYRLAVLDLTRPKGPQNPKPLPVKIPRHSEIGPCTSDGNYIAYRTMMGPVFIVDLETGVHTKVFEPEGTCTLYWVE